MQLLAERLAASPLVEGQRVLALTFMHGARRRLVDRLRTVPGLAGRVECSTIDGFAWRLLRRWRGQASALGILPIAEDEFDAVCDAAGALLEQPQIRAWASTSFPIVLVDEGQDLRPERLRMLVALSGETETQIAADEFQCLDPMLRPNPLVAWVREAVQPEILTEIRRTNVAGLLNAAAAVRNGQAPANSGQQFRMLGAPSVPFAAAAVANAIAWHPGTENVAIITPALAGGFAQAVVKRVCAGPCGQQGNGPFQIKWEGTDRDETLLITAKLGLEALAPAPATLAALHQLPRSGPVRSTISWVERQIHALGRTEFTRDEIEAIIARYVTLSRQFSGAPTQRFTAMTVQQAKNREFDGVVVLWPYQVGGDAEHKRRLLYNAITRAKRWCNVIVQGQNIPAAPPFA
jgi:hypothetical protein